MASKTISLISFQLLNLHVNGGYRLIKTTNSPNFNLTNVLGGVFG